MRHTRSTTRALLPALALLIWIGAHDAAAAVPKTLAVQGVLRSVGGGAVADGPYILTFALYGAEKGGAAVWKEGPEVVDVKGGAFSWILGGTKPLPPALLGQLQSAWLGVRVAKDPELPRKRLRSVAFALRAEVAEALDCSGCLGGSQLGQGSIGPDKLGFTWAGSQTKGGPAKSAADLQCTGCVSVSEMKFDQDVDLGGHGLKAKTLTAGSVVAQKIIASSFSGDGSKLTGLKIPAGSCPKPGEVVTGIAPDGSLKCVPGLDASSLPPDGIVQVSNGLLSNRYIDAVISSKTPLPIPDNNPLGVFDELDLPDLGLVKTLTVHVALANSDLSTLTVWLFDPTNSLHVLYDKGGKGTSLKGTWPAPDKQVKGDLGAWAGKNPKGKWRLKVVDTGKGAKPVDGAVTAFRISVQTISAKKITATGDLVVKGTLLAEKGIDLGQGEARFMRLHNAAAEPVKCTPKVLGLIYYDTKTSELRVCNGKDYKAFATTYALGSEEKPAKDCQAIHAAGDAKGDGVYWLDHGGKAIKAYCDMKNGGWTLVASWPYANKPGQWGKVAYQLSDPKPGTKHALPFVDILPKPKQVRLVYLPKNQTISYGIKAGAAWQMANGGARIQVSNGWWLIWDTQNAAVGVCVVNGSYSNGYTCDGNSGQIGGQGMFNANTADEFCNCNTHGWKHGTGGCKATVCGAGGQVAVWMR